MESNECREAFEKEFPHINHDVDSDGCYLDEFTAAIYCGYKSAWNRRAPQQSAQEAQPSNHREAMQAALDALSGLSKLGEQHLKWDRRFDDAMDNADAAIAKLREALGANG